MRRGGDFFASYAGQWRHFLDAVRGDVPVECSARDGRQALEIALAAAASAPLGRPVALGSAPATRADSVAAVATRSGAGVGE